MKLHARFLLLPAAALSLSACAIFSEPNLLPETPERLAQGELMIKNGDELIAKGEALQDQGKDMIKEGKRLEDEGEEMIKRGEKAIEAAKTLEKAERLRREGESMRQTVAP